MERRAWVRLERSGKGMVIDRGDIQEEAFRETWILSLVSLSEAGKEWEAVRVCGRHNELRIGTSWDGSN